MKLEYNMGKKGETTRMIFQHRYLGKISENVWLKVTARIALRCLKNKIKKEKDGDRVMEGLAGSTYP